MNEQHSELQYVIYRKEEGQANNQYKPITTVSGDTYIYRDEGLTTTKKYWYTLKSLSVWGEESEEASNAVTENWIWPVLDPYIQTQHNRFLFYQEKINTVSWSSNPLNNAITVDRYDIYRKRTTQDTEYALLTSVQADVYEYRNRGLLESEQYSYTIVAVDTEGNESTPCEPVSED